MRDNRVVATLEVEAIDDVSSIFALAGVATGSLLIAVLSFALILTGWCMKCSVHKRIASQVGTQFFLTDQRNSSVLDSPGFRSFV